MWLVAILYPFMTLSWNLVVVPRKTTQYFCVTWWRKVWGIFLKTYQLRSNLLGTWHIGNVNEYTPNGIIRFFSQSIFSLACCTAKYSHWCGRVICKYNLSGRTYKCGKNNFAQIKVSVRNHGWVLIDAGKCVHWGMDTKLLFLLHYFF